MSSLVQKQRGFGITDGFHFHGGLPFFDDGLDGKFAKAAIGGKERDQFRDPSRQSAQLFIGNHGFHGRLPVCLKHIPDRILVQKTMVENQWMVQVLGMGPVETPVARNPVDTTIFIEITRGQSTQHPLASARPMICV